MTLGDIIKDYRKQRHISMDIFSEKSGISKSYISLLEKNRHPKTGEPIAPSISIIKQAADGMNMDFNILFSKIDGDVTLTEESRELTKATPKILRYYDMLNDIGKHEATKRVEELTLIPRYMKEPPAEYLGNAAHVRTDIEVTDEMRAHDDDIMDDEDF